MEHKAKFIGTNIYNDQYECSCGWKSNTYYDGDIYAYEEFKRHWRQKTAKPLKMAHSCCPQKRDIKPPDFILQSSNEKFSIYECTHCRTCIIVWGDGPGEGEPPA